MKYYIVYSTGLSDQNTFQSDYLFDVERLCVLNKNSKYDTLNPMLRASLCLTFTTQDHRRRLGADFGGPGKNFADQSFRMTFFRKKFPFQRRKFLMTLFSRRLYFVCFCLSLLSYYYTPVYCYITYKTTISEKIPLPHLLYSVHSLLSYASIRPNTTSPNIGGTDAWAVPTSNFGAVLQFPLSLRPCPRLPVLKLEPTTHSLQPRVHQRSYSMHFSDRYACMGAVIVFSAILIFFSYICRIVTRNMSNDG